MGQVIFKNISKIYNKDSDHEVKALDNLSFSIDKGEFVVILGPSGAGKSTLLNVMGGMDLITSGSFQVDNVDISKLNDKDLSKYRQDKVGFVFQFYNLMANLTALENVQIAESLTNDSLSSYDVIKSVGLEKRMNNFPSELSGGEQQRVAIARAIVKNPTLLLCDEPTGALDSKTGGMIINLLVDMCKKYKKTVIIVTHNSKIAQVASRVIHIQDGKIAKDIHVKEKDRINPTSIKW